MHCQEELTDDCGIPKKGNPHGDLGEAEKMKGNSQKPKTNMPLFFLRHGENLTCSAHRCMDESLMCHGLTARARLRSHMVETELVRPRILPSLVLSE